MKCSIDGRSRLLFFLLRRSQTPRKHAGRLESYPYTLSLFQPFMPVPYFHVLPLEFCKVGTNTHLAVPFYVYLRDGKGINLDENFTR